MATSSTPATKKPAAKKSDPGVLPGDIFEPKKINLVKGIDFGVVVVTVKMADPEKGKAAKVEHILVQCDPTMSMADKSFPVVEFDEQMAVLSGEIGTAQASITLIAEWDAKRNITATRASVNCHDGFSKEMRSTLRRTFTGDATAALTLGYEIKLIEKPKTAPAATPKDKAATPTKAPAKAATKAAPTKAPAKRPAKSDAPVPTAAKQRRGPVKKATPTDAPVVPTAAKKRGPVKKAVAPATA
jgi:hypothetical protein